MSNTYENIAAGLEYFSTPDGVPAELNAGPGSGMGLTQNGAGPIQVSPRIEDAFQAALVNAKSKATAVTIRVTVGDAAGCTGSWSTDDGQTWTQFKLNDGTILDTRGYDAGTVIDGDHPDYYGDGNGPRFFADTEVYPNPVVVVDGTQDLHIGFHNLFGSTWIDDVVLETNPDMGGGAGLPWTESWDSLDLDTAKWETAGHNPPMFHMAPIDPGDGDLAFLMGNAALDWSTKLRSKVGWPRGENLRCTFDLFGLDDTSRLGMDFVHTYPGASGFHGPFHSTADIGENIYATIDAGMDFWWNIIGFEEGGAATGLQTTNFTADDAFHAAMHPAGRDPEEAVGRDTGIKMRFWAGDVSGFFMEWSLDGGVTWTPGATWPDSNVYDTRGQDMMTRPDDEVVPTGNATLLYLGFSTAQGGVFIDNICVGNDSNPCVQGTPTPNEVDHWTFY